MWLLFQYNVHVCIAHHLLIKGDKVACGYCSSIMYAHSIYIYLLKWIRWHYVKTKKKTIQYSYIWKPISNTQFNRINGNTINVLGFFWK